MWLLWGTFSQNHEGCECDPILTLMYSICKAKCPRHSVQVYTTNILYIFTWISCVCLCLKCFVLRAAHWKQNKSGFAVESGPESSLRGQRVAISGCVRTSPKALGVVRCPLSVHSDAWLPVSHRLSDTKTSDGARSVNTTVQQTHPLPVTQTALKGRGRWHSMYSTTDTRLPTALLCNLGSDKKKKTTVLCNSHLKCISLG